MNTATHAVITNSRDFLNFLLQINPTSLWSHRLLVELRLHNSHPWAQIIGPWVRVGCWRPLQSMVEDMDQISSSDGSTHTLQ